MKYKIDIKPFSINGAYRGKITKTFKLKQYERDLAFLLPSKKIDFKGEELMLEIILGFSSKGSDIDNPQKPIMDALAKKYNYNDNQIYRLVLTKLIVPKGQEYFEFNLTII